MERLMLTTLLLLVFFLGYLVSDTNIGPDIQSPFGEDYKEALAPNEHITKEQIIVYSDRVVLEIQDAEWAEFTPTGSMKPVFDHNANAIEIVPSSPDQIDVGDIVSYDSKYMPGFIIHRVVEIGSDEEGWYAIMKGDNNSQSDPGRVRFDQIKRLVVAIVY